jgi:hypothetical protein
MVASAKQAAGGGGLAKHGHMVSAATLEVNGEVAADIHQGPQFAIQRHELRTHADVHDLVCRISEICYRHPITHDVLPADFLRLIIMIAMVVRPGTFFALDLATHAFTKACAHAFPFFLPFIFFKLADLARNFLTAACCCGLHPF